MKCFKCGTEFDDRFRHFCPLCCSEQPKSKAIMNKVWENFFSLLTIAIYLLALTGISKIWCDNAAIVLFFPLMILWLLSYSKIQKKKESLRGEKIANLLRQYDEHLINGEDAKAAIIGGEICSIARDEGPH